MFIGKGKVHCESANIVAFNTADEGGAELLLTAAPALVGTSADELHGFARPIIAELTGGMFVPRHETQNAGRLGHVMAWASADPLTLSYVIE